MLLLLASPTIAATLTVGPTGMYATIGEAEAAATDGDVIQIAAGVYFEILDPGGKDLTYTSSAGAIITAVDPCLSVSGAESVTVRGLTFDACGNAVVVSGGATVELEDTIFRNNNCDEGCAISASGASTVTVSGATFQDNTAGYWGGSIAANVGATVSVVDSSFSGGVATYGGELWVDRNATLTVESSTFEQALADYGGALYGYGADVSLTEVTIAECLATSGGGAHFEANTRTLLDRVRFVQNESTGNGGGLYAYRNDELEIAASAFLGNVAGGSGGGLFAQDDAAWIGASLFLENTASSSGGGLFLQASGRADLESLAFACNTAGDAGAFELTASIVTLESTFAASNGYGGYRVYPGSFAPVANLVWGNDGYDWAGTVSDPTGSDGNVSVDPQVRFLTCDGDWTNDDLAPASGSPLIDAGNLTDVDASTGDIGAYGGLRGDQLDADGDGYGYWNGDCHEGRADAHPGGVEVWYDGVDQDCDGNDDDQDEDGYALAEDCDDTDAAVNPGMAEVWYDGTDQDCDGNDDDRDFDGYAVGDDCDDTDPTSNPGATETWYDGIDQDCDGNDLDQDRDGEGVFTDCDDTDPTAYPGATEVWYDGTDQDCDGNDDDQDGDGYGLGADCDDENPAVNPDAEEIWYDGVDQDCDGEDGDQDGDGYDATVDCDDLDPAIHPDAAETWYDGVDQDCAGDDDFDQDADGARALAEGGDDCDDLDATVFPGATEVWYDGTDQDCDGNDTDQDGDGDSALDAGGSDCVDSDPSIYLGAEEIWYDGIDQDCDGRDDDRDGDGFVRAEDCDDDDDAVVRCITRIDGGCSSSGASPTWLLALAAALLVLRRGSPLLLFAGPAFALDASGNGRAPTDAGGLLRAGGIAAGPAGNLDVGLSAGFAGTTAEATWDDGTQTTLLGGLATLQLGVGWTFLDGVRVEGGLPVVLGATVPEDFGPGLGDAWLGAQWAVLRTDALSLGPSLEVTLPSGDPTRLLGGGGVGGVLALAAGGAAGPVRWGAEVGGGIRATDAYDRLVLAPEPELRASGGARVAVAGPLLLGAELVGRVGLGADNADTLTTSGAEAFLTAGLGLERLDVALAGGVGLLDGVGTPDARVVLAVRSRVLAAGPRAEDADADGVPDARDRCPSAAEDRDGFQDDDGCPDLDDDADGVPDATDRCPADPEDDDGFQDDDGCPDTDDDADGLADGFDACPRDAGPAETNGCPDRDRDGMLDGADRCPDTPALPGTVLAYSDGCPGLAVVFADRVHLVGPVSFDAGRATLRPDARATLAEAAAILVKYPDLGRIEIGAHVPGGGDPKAALKLTTARAEAVRKALVAAGVPEARLVVQGYGDARLVAPDDTAENRSKNERIELRLLR